jgi:hypothetical protein
VPRDPAAIRRLQEQAGVADDPTRGVVGGDEERGGRDRWAVHVPRPELGQVAGRHRRVATGDVGERLDGQGVDAVDQVRALGERRQRDARRQLDGRRRQPGELEVDGLAAFVLAEAAMQQELDAVGAPVRRRDMEGDLAGRPGTL